MEFHEKLQELRKQKGLTQEELADSLYVSRTAVSKWESGRGYPNIESLKAIAKFFSVTVDMLLSGEEVLSIAEDDCRRKENYFCDFVYGLLDLSMVMLLFLPFFASKVNGDIQSVSLLVLFDVQPYLKTVYFVSVIGMTLLGIIALALQNCYVTVWLKYKRMISLLCGMLSVLLFVISLQPYAAVFSFLLLVIKALMLIKRP